ncbi:MAG: DUF4890 domain-containing protein [Prevotella sp.]|nr:DUF4890 domain-containing protein [Prevotella sp.]
MKKLFVTMAMVVALTTANAQTEKPQRQPRMDRTEMMVKEYGLNADQAAKLKKLNEKYADMFQRGPRGGRPGGPRGGARPQGQMQPPADGQSGASGQAQRPPRQDGNGNHQKRMEENRQKMDQYNKELQGIMTSAQYQAYQKKMEEMRKNRPQRKKKN